MVARNSPEQGTDSEKGFFRCRSSRTCHRPRSTKEILKHRCRFRCGGDCEGPCCCEVKYWASICAYNETYFFAASESSGTFAALAFSSSSVSSGSGSRSASSVISFRMVQETRYLRRTGWPIPRSDFDGPLLRLGMMFSFSARTYSAQAFKSCVSC